MAREGRGSVALLEVADVWSGGAAAADSEGRALKIGSGGAGGSGGLIAAATAWPGKTNSGASSFAALTLLRGFGSGFMRSASGEPAPCAFMIESYAGECSRNAPHAIGCN